MGFFTKEEKTHFERDEAGNVVRVTRNGRQVDPDEMQMKSSRQLEREYYEKHPQEKHKTLRKIGAVAKKVDKQIVNYNRRNNPMYQKPYHPQGRHVHRNYNLLGDMFDTGMNFSGPQTTRRKQKSKPKYHIVGGKAYPIAGSGKKKKKRSSRNKRSSGFDMMDNWGLMK